MTTAGDTSSIYAGPLRRGWVRRKAALLSKQLIRFALFADGAHEPDIVSRQERCRLFSFLSSASCSSSRRSAPSLLSYAPSVSDSDERGDAGRTAVRCLRRWRRGASGRRRRKGGRGSRGRATRSCRSGSSDRHARPDAERGCEPDGPGCSREAVSAAVVCGVRAQRAFEDLKPAEVVLIEQIRKGDVEAGKANMARGGARRHSP